jgi:hypothetical protein
VRMEGEVESNITEGTDAFCRGLEAALRFIKGFISCISNLVDCYCGGVVSRHLIY